VEYIAGDALALVESGQADIAVGIEPDWNAMGRVDFTQPYMLHGERLMVRKNSNIDGFGSRELINRWIAVINTDEGAQARAQAWADSVNVRVQFYVADEAEIASSILVENNADVAYADSLKLLSALIENGDKLVLTERWYSRNYLALAVPRNDHDFRLLVDYTLQAMFEANELLPLLQPLTPPGSETPQFAVYPGQREIAGILIN
jgi:ABC-type amino acid transport substrate-binding protein